MLRDALEKNVPGYKDYRTMIVDGCGSRLIKYQLKIIYDPLLDTCNQRVYRFAYPLYVCKR